MSFSYDYLKITDENNVTVGKYCGQRFPREVILGADYAVITFHTNDKIEKTGFYIRFSAVNPSKYWLNDFVSLT